MENRIKRRIALPLSLLLFGICGLDVAHAEVNYSAERSFRSVTIENFDDGEIVLSSYPGEDIDPDAWELDSLNTYQNSAYSLRLYGNTWKIEPIAPVILDTGDVWSVAAYIENVGEIQGFGLADTACTLLYSFAGSEMLDIENWVTVYQGAFSNYTWNIYQLPVGADWLAWFGYVPTVTDIVFINDLDTGPHAAMLFDDILNVTEDLPVAPLVFIEYSTGRTLQAADGTRSIDVHFYSTIVDSDSDEHTYCWFFGDGITSSDSNPVHTYTIKDDHEYTVLLEVVDDTGLRGRAFCSVSVEYGPGTFPFVMNFVGDVMLARKYEWPGGIIPTQGVEVIFEPTLPFLGDAADITVANLECPLTASGTPHPSKPIIFRGSPDNVDGLVYAGIDVVTLANNHIIDYGLEGLRETQSVLSTNGILYSGAGANSYEAYDPVFYVKNGVSIAFLASSDRTGQYNNYQPYLNAGFNKPGFANLTLFDAVNQIDAVRAYADIVVVELHAGSEYSLAPRDSDGACKVLDQYGDEFYSPDLLAPSRADIELRRSIIDNGADAVICHHPHIIQGFEIYNGKLIAHSLGNFVFDLDYPETYWSMILNARINETGLYGYSVTPIYIDDYIPVRAEGELGLHMLDYVARRSRDLDTYLIVDRDSVVARIVMDSLTLRPTQFARRHECRLHEDSGMWISEPFRLDKTGSISKVHAITPGNDWQFRLGREVIWFGNFEDEGSTLWMLNDNGEQYDDTVSYRGKRSMCHCIPPGGYSLITNFEERVKCYSDTSCYTLHGCVKSSNAANARIEVRYYTERMSLAAAGACSISPVSRDTFDWTFYYREFVPSSNTGHFDIWLRSDPPQYVETGYAWFDDVGIVEWSEWLPFDQSAIIKTPNDYYWMQIRTTQEIHCADVTYKTNSYTSVPLQNYYQTPARNSDRLELYPNPSSGYAVIRYTLVRNGKVELAIYNVIGQRMKTLVNGTQSSGFKSVIWDGKDSKGRSVGSGVYFCRLQTAEGQYTSKVILHH